MYKPKFNSVLVEIDDADAKWGNGNDESMLGKSYSKGKVVAIGPVIETGDHPVSKPDPIVLANELETFVGKDIMWNEGVEAGTTFEDGGKLYGFIYWSDIRGVKE